MNRKIWLIVLLLGSLILLLGGMHRPERPADPGSDDPMVRNAEAVVSQNVSGTGNEWRKTARDNPMLILQIEAVEE